MNPGPRSDAWARQVLHRLKPKIPADIWEAAEIEGAADSYEIALVEVLEAVPQAFEVSDVATLEALMLNWPVLIHRDVALAAISRYRVSQQAT